MKKTSLMADLSAGAASALVALPVAIGGGILVTTPLGPEYGRGYRQDADCGVALA